MSVGLEDSYGGVIEEIAIASLALSKLLLAACGRTVRLEELERHPNGLEQDELTRGLDDIAVVRDLSDTLDVAFLGVAGEKNDRHGVALEDPFGRLNAVDSRTQIDVHEDEVDRRVVLQMPDRLFS